MRFIRQGGTVAAAIFLAACAAGGVRPISTQPAQPSVTMTTGVMPSPDATGTADAATTPATRPPTPSTRPSEVLPNPSSTISVLLSSSASTNKISVREESLRLDAYPYEAFSQDAVDRTYNFAYKKFDALAYGAAPRKVAPKRFKTVVIENEYLRLTFLPELGGRLWQVLYKPTQQTLFYNNRVLKPTPWGPEQQGGWLAAGGMEWALPVNEHGYEWGIPWSYSISSTANSVTIALQDWTANDRVRARVSVTLPAQAAYFIVHPRIENPTGAAVRLQFWINAQLGLSTNNVAPSTEFVLPTAQVFVHSNGNDFVPPANVPTDTALSPAAPISWPLVAGHDLSRYGNWNNYLGVFAAGPGDESSTSSATSFVGAYNHANNLGIVRVFSRDRAPGVKLFAFGPNFDRQLIGDDGSDYFELWGGIPRTFFRNDDVTFAPGESREWDEYWIPFTGIGGLSAATRDLVLSLSVGERVTVGAMATTRHTNGSLVLYRDAVEAKRWNVTLEPGRSFQEQMTGVGGGKMRLRFTAADGTLLAETP